MRPRMMAAVPVILGCAAFLTAPAAQPPGARTTDRTAEHKKAVDVFNQTIKKYRSLDKTFGDDDKLFDFNFDTPGGKVKCGNAIAVWAELADADGKPTGEFASLVNNTWPINQRLRLWVKCGAPDTIVFLWGDHTVNNRVERVQMLPHDKRAGSKQPLEVGKAVPLPYTFVITRDGGLKDTAAIGFASVKSPGVPNPTKEDDVKAFFEDVRKRTGMVGGSFVTPPAKLRSTSEEDVYIVFGTREQAGDLELVFDKK